jgi:hypothetical protein
VTEELAREQIDRHGRELVQTQAASVRRRLWELDVLLLEVLDVKGFALEDGAAVH